jgi:hypothetical protein
MIEACSNCLDPETRAITGQIAESAVETLRDAANELWDNTNNTLRRVLLAAPELETKKDELFGAQAGIIFQTSEASMELDGALADANTVDCESRLKNADSLAPFCPRAEHVKCVVKQILKKLGDANG